MVLDPDLASFLACYSPVVTEPVTWGNRFRFRVATYLGAAQAPLSYVTSVRAVILRDGLVLVQRDPDAVHILPGGRREEGESPAATLHREIGEETGWTLRLASQIGFMHYHHLDPKPPDFAYPYPDFLHVVFTARAATFSPEAKLDDGYEIESEFRPIADVRTLALSRGEQVYLDAALRTEELTSE